MTRAIVLLSGGMDSLVTAACAVSECDEVCFLHFNYGQLTEKKELSSFEALVNYYQPIQAKVINYSWLSEIGGSALTDRNIPFRKESFPVLKFLLPMFLSGMPYFFVLQLPGQKLFKQQEFILELWKKTVPVIRIAVRFFFRHSIK